MPLLNLPSDVLKNVANFIPAYDAINYANISKKTKDVLNLAIFDDTYSHQLTDQQWTGGYVDGDQERIWFRFMPLLLKNQIHTVQFTCIFRDQGWGNQKGQLYIREDKNRNNYLGDIIARSPIAKHDETILKLSFQPKPDKNYTMCYTVGGGGGHELFVKNPCIRQLLYNNDGIVDVGNKFNHKSIAPVVNNNFGSKMMIGIIDSLIRCIENDLDQDAGLASSFISVGFDTTNICELRAMKKFLINLIEFRGESISE